MRKTKLFLLCLLAISLAFGFQSCKKDKDNSPSNNTETPNGTKDDQDDDDSNDDSDNNDPVPPTFTFSENLNAENKTIENGAELKLTIGNLTAESIVSAFLDDQPIEVNDGVIILPTTTAGEYKIKVVVGNEEKEFSFKVLLPALEIKNCALSSDETEFELNSELKLNLEANNPCTITVKVNGNAIEANDGVYVLPTDKAGEFAVSVEFNDGQNGVQTKDLSYKVFNGLFFSVNGVKFKMIRVSGFEGGDFYIGETEVTQALWAEVMKNTDKATPSYTGHPNSIGDNYPVNQVSWNDIRNEDNGFLKKLNEATGKNFRLSSGAEWVYAAKGGDPDAVYSGCRTLDSLQYFAWYPGSTNGAEGCHEVATKKANGYGIYDMSGNVWEWCEDNVGYQRVFRGCCWNSSPNELELSFRPYDRTSWSHSTIGFRLALSL